jgi:hypothetical protein
MDKKYDTMEKKLADSFRRLEEQHLILDKEFASIKAKYNARFDDIDTKIAHLISTVDNLARQLHRSRSHSSRSSSRSNHGSHHERHRQPHPQEHGANQQPHLDSLSERKKPTPSKDESHIHLERKSDTPHEWSEDILLSNNLTSTPLVLSSSLLGCSDDDDVHSMEMRDSTICETRESTICEMSESTICEMSESTICESECFHFEGMSDTSSQTRVVVDRSNEAISISNNLPSTSNVFSHVAIDSMDEAMQTLEKMYMVHTLDDNTPCLEDDEHVSHMELPTDTSQTYL